MDISSSIGFVARPQLVHPAWRDFRIVRFNSTLTQVDYCCIVVVFMQKKYDI